MLKVAIENSYTKTYKGEDEFGNKFFMQEFFKKNGIELTRVSVNKTNNKNEFTEYSTIKNGKTHTFKKKYKPDIIRSRRGLGTFYKYSKLEKSYKISPSKKISIISNDKFETYLFCKNHQPKTFLLSSFFGKENKNMSSDKLVIKPIRANGGKGIKLTTFNELYKNKNKFLGLEELYIVQEFKDFSKGYPGITKGNHDVRLMFAGRKIIEATLRTPKKGDFRSNICSGGTQKPLDKNLLPNDLIKLSKKIQKELNLQGDDIMSMDFAYCANDKRRYFIEINASPGTRYYQTDKIELKKICKGLVVFFKSLNK